MLCATLCEFCRQPRFAPGWASYFETTNFKGKKASRGYIKSPSRKSIFLFSYPQVIVGSATPAIMMVLVAFALPSNLQLR